MRRVLLVGGCVGALAWPAAAGAAGGPVPPMQGGPGIAAPGGGVSYVAVGTGRRTLVEQVLRGGGIGRTRMVDGVFGVPGAAYDNSTTGLSADGRTLVLAEVAAHFPVRRTRLLVMDARGLRVVRRVTLPGYVTVDAISPDGRSLYLLRYPGQDGIHYEVRAYDLARGRLLRAPVVDPREAGEKMQGVAMTRAMSADGRVAYTLYMRPTGEPFIHVLDTARGVAACIDLPTFGGRDLSGVRLTPPARGRPLLVRGPGFAPVAVDVAARRARPLNVPRPPSPPAAASAPVAAGRDDTASSGLGGVAVLVVPALAAAGLVGGLLFAARRRRRRRAEPATQHHEVVV
jgi:hypothetical protein